jgi:hypothetical protein
MEKTELKPIPICRILFGSELLEAAALICCCFGKLSWWWFAVIVILGILRDLIVRIDYLRDRRTQ